MRCRGGDYSFSFRSLPEPEGISLRSGGVWLRALLLALLLPLSCRDAAPPLPSPLLSREVRVGILTRYHPRRVRIRLSSMMLHTETRSQSVTGELLLRVKGERIMYEYRSTKTYQAPERGSTSHLFLDPPGQESSSPLEVTVLEGEKTGEQRRRQTVTGPPSPPVRRSYDGSLEVRVRNGELLLVNQLPSERYIARVSAAELGPLLPADPRSPGGGELRQAMEIVVRSYLNHNLHRHEAAGYDLCDLTHCMFYPGALSTPPSLSSAAPAVLVDRKGGILQGYFHSACGGVLSSPGVMWPASSTGRDLYASGVDESPLVETKPLCQSSPSSHWQTHLREEELLRIIHDERVVKLKSLETRMREERVAALLYTGRDRAGNLLRGELPVASFLSRAGREVGWNRIKSNLFRIIPGGRGYLFSGRGLGHGVGLCQWGAAAMARQGIPHEEILHHYFPGAEIRTGVFP